VRGTNRERAKAKVERGENQHGFPKKKKNETPHAKQTKSDKTREKVRKKPGNHKNVKPPKGFIIQEAGFWYETG